MAPQSSDFGRASMMQCLDWNTTSQTCRFGIRNSTFSVPHRFDQDNKTCQVNLRHRKKN
jgi:hypothetical protein